MAHAWVLGTGKILASYWARVRARAEPSSPEPLSEDEIAKRSEITKRVPDLLAASRLILPADKIVNAVPEAIRKFEEGMGATVEYIGNWWVEGNPYKGINCTFLEIRGEGAGWVRFEIQFHTDESAKLADQNHGLYEIARDSGRPLKERQEAYDQMVSSFARIPHPPGIDAIGERMAKSRPISSLDGQKRALDEAEEFAKSLALRTGATISLTTPKYPAELEKLLDSGLDQLDSKDHAGALKTFDKAIALYSNNWEEWAVRGVALATLRSGYALVEMGNYVEAIARCDGVAKMSGDEIGARTLGMGALGYQVEELRRATLAKVNRMNWSEVKEQP